MSPKKQPSNYDLAADIKELKDMMGAVVSDVKTLMSWKDRVEIAKSAVDEYKRQEFKDRANKESRRETLSRTEILKEVSKILGLLTLALYAYLASKGIHIG